jgi:hypothetical protein
MCQSGKNIGRAQSAKPLGTTMVAPGLTISNGVYVFEGFRRINLKTQFRFLMVIPFCETFIKMTTFCETFITMIITFCETFIIMTIFCETFIVMITFCEHRFHKYLQCPC